MNVNISEAGSSDEDEEEEENKEEEGSKIIEPVPNQRKSNHFRRSNTIINIIKGVV